MTMRHLTNVFLDRDGVINRKQPEGAYVTSWAEFAFLPRAQEAIRLLNDAGLRVIIVTNQRGIARGTMRAEDVGEIHRRMQEALARHGARIDAIFVCPHDYGQCDCRKPAVGLFLQARAAYPEIDFARAVMLGDSLSDLLPCRELGCAAVLVADAARRERLLPEIAAHGIALDGAADDLYAAVTQFVLAGGS